VVATVATVAEVAAVAAVADAAEVDDERPIRINPMKFAFGIVALGMGLVVTPGVAFVKVEHGYAEEELEHPDGLKAHTESNSNDSALTGNLPPNRIWLNNDREMEELPIGRVVGRAWASDPDDPNATGVYRFSLVEGNGSSHNGLFSLDRNGVLRTAAVLDYETNASLKIRIRVTDEHGAKLEESFTIKVLDWSEDGYDTDKEEEEEEEEEEPLPEWFSFLLMLLFLGVLYWCAKGIRGSGGGGSSGGGGGGCGGCGGGGCGGGG